MLKGDLVPQFILSMLAVLRVFFRSRSDTALEVLALRQQVAVLKRKRPRPVLKLYGPVVLDHPVPLLVPLEGRSHHRHARHRNRLAPRWIPPLLALAIPPARRPANNYRRNPQSDSKHGLREPRLGSSQDPWRVAEARLRRVGTQCSPVSCEGWSAGGRRPKGALSSSRL